MAHNPLLGSRISLISKKNIRYEGTLYSINESDATVALQNVRSYGTEGRETEASFVAPQDVVHPYLLFRGCDIKDLHVHESSDSKTEAKEDVPSDPAILSTEAPPEAKETTPDPPKAENENDEKERPKEEVEVTEEKENLKESEKVVKEKEVDSEKVEKSNTRKSQNRRRNNQGPRQMVGSGASLLNRKARGVVKEESNKAELQEDFDFESKLKEFEIEDDDDDDEQDDFGNSGNTTVYQKDDFFDSISCDVLDKQAGRDNRLRGAEERNLNIDTFGATSLGYERRGRRSRNGYRGRGRGRGRGGRGSRPRENQRWNRDDAGESGRNDYGNGNRRNRTYGDGGLSANKSQT